MFRRIIVPLDGSHVAARAIPYAARLARAFDGSLTLLSVIPLPETPLGTPRVVLADAAERGRAMADAYLEQIAEPLRTSGVTVTTMTCTGNPAQVILQVAEREGKSLVALTTHGRSGLERVQLGSVAQHVVRHATVPILVVGGTGALGTGDEPGITGITVTLDGSTIAETALPHAVAIAKAMAVPLTLFSVIPDDMWPAIAAATAFISYPTERVARKEVADMADYLTEIAAGLRQPGLVIETAWQRSATSRVEEAIVAHLSARPHELVVMASHGRGGILRWALGSTAEVLVAHPPCPVLVIHPHARPPRDIEHVLAMETSAPLS